MSLTIWNGAAGADVAVHQARALAPSVVSEGASHDASIRGAAARIVRARKNRGADSYRGKRSRLLPVSIGREDQARVIGAGGGGLHVFRSAGSDREDSCAAGFRELDRALPRTDRRMRRSAGGDGRAQAR